MKFVTPIYEAWTMASDKEGLFGYAAAHNYYTVHIAFYHPIARSDVEAMFAKHKPSSLILLLDE